MGSSIESTKQRRSIGAVRRFDLSIGLLGVEFLYSGIVNCAAGVVFPAALCIPVWEFLRTRRGPSVGALAHRTRLLEIGGVGLLVASFWSGTRRTPPRAWSLSGSRLATTAQKAAAAPHQDPDLMGVEGVVEEHGERLGTSGRRRPPPGCPFLQLDGSGPGCCDLGIRPRASVRTARARAWSASLGVGVELSGGELPVARVRTACRARPSGSLAGPPGLRPYRIRGAARCAGLVLVGGGGVAGRWVRYVGADSVPGDQ
ncbi:hypothetical protein YW3DRAFT_05778 [Streptomyces sp. MnatMP-M77]|nr:hypothetical protein YW3DRAFT_05778 [Streptomyces sp. MnatMP-M77]